MASVEFLDYFADIQDPRIERHKLYPIDEILLTTFCAVISGAEGWIDVETYGKLKLSLLKNYLPFNHGTPSDDTFRRFFRALDPKAFHNCFIQWVHSFAQSSQIAIDGKTLRGSKDAEQNPLHLISAFATEANLVLAQKKVDGKSNEITAIPELLNWLDLRGAIVTIDAMGCQKRIAREITAKGGDFVLGLKGNHPGLFQEVKDYFKKSALQGHSEWNKGHGRLEQRVCYASDEVEWLLAEWPEVKSLVMVESRREIQGKTSQEKRYYLSSLDAEPERLLKLIRSHWAIENSLHWVLDMSFGEDQSRIRKGNGPENMAVLRHLALNAIRKIKGKRDSIKGVRKAAGWDDSIVARVLAVA